MYLCGGNEQEGFNSESGLRFKQSLDIQYGCDMMQYRYADSREFLKFRIQYGLDTFYK